MRVKVTKNKNSQSFYVIKDVNVNGKRTTKIVAALGNEAQLRKAHPDYEPLIWAREQAKILTQKEKNNLATSIKKFSAAKLIEKDKQRSFNVGYLFLQDIISKLGLKRACQHIQKATKTEYNLYNILALLIYARILAPGSKKSSLAYMKEMLGVEVPKLHDLYRALSLLAEHKEELVSASYHHSTDIKPRDTRVLYYDCTNFYFEIEAAEDMKQYGVSKEHRPNPIIQMGLFMDANGLPLSFTLFDGNKNEQPSMKPLEKKIMRDFKLSDFVVCTDAGLSSNQNRRYNSFGNRHFVTTQSIKKLKKNLKEWALDPNGWQKPGNKQEYNLNELDLENDDSVYYKMRPINENDLEQNLFVTFSPKYLRYQRQIRQGQIDRAIKQANSKQRRKRSNPNDPARFIKEKHFTKDGEKANQVQYLIDEDKIKKEALFDGFYGICTDLEASPLELIKINKNRWEIERCFREMKTEFQARPVYLRREERIKSHFLVCFLALLVFRLFKQEVPGYSSYELAKTLRQFNLAEINPGDYIPIFQRTDLTDKIHKSFGFRLDRELITQKYFKKICQQTKKEKKYAEIQA